MRIFLVSLFFTLFAGCADRPTSGADPVAAVELESKTATSPAMLLASLQDLATQATNQYEIEVTKAQIEYNRREIAASQKSSMIFERINEVEGKVREAQLGGGNK